MNKNLFLLGLVFFFIFLGYSAVQQFITSYFLEIGKGGLGFYSLTLVYSGFLIGNLFLVGIIQKLGNKKSMIFGMFFYAIYIFSLLIPYDYLIYFTSFLLGISASFLWIGQQTYLVEISDEKNIGKNYSVVNIFLFLGASIGSIILGKIISIYGYKEGFLLFGFFPVIAILMSLFLKKTKKVYSESNKTLFGFLKYFKNTDLLKLGFFYSSITFTTGLFFSIIPIHIGEVLGISYVGIVTFLFYFSVMLLLYFAGKIVDKYCNKKLIISLHLIGIISMIFLLFYDLNNYFIYLGIFILSILYAGITPIIGALIYKLSSKKNIEYISSFFLIFSNIGIILGILISSFINTKNIYLIGIILLFIALIGYLTLYKKSFIKIKKEII